MTYAWPIEERRVWEAKRTFALRMAERLLPPQSDYRGSRRHGA